MKHLSLTQDLYGYMLRISLREHPVLCELRSFTDTLSRKYALGNMATAPEQAQFMQFLLKLIQAQHVLELGTYTGYSALAMALALPEKAKLITCDINKEWTSYAKSYWEKAGQAEKIDLRLSPALNTLEDLLKNGYAETFDFIFIDADKTNYLNYYEYALKLISPKGLIAIDNIFWGGQVLDEKDKTAQTREIRRLNEHIKEDKRVDLSLLAIGDGLLLTSLRS